MNNGYPFMYPGMYSPGQMAFNNNPELSQLVSMFAGPLLGQMAGPGNFVPHMMPGQALMDQFAMRNYQNQTRTASFNLAAAGPQNNDVANRLLGMRSAFTGEAATDMNREQAMNMAQILNNPMTKTFAGMLMGPENVEMMLHGSRGDVQSLGNTVNRIGYYRKDPGGGGRMDANSLEDLTTGVFSHLYEPQGDTEKLAATARAGGAAGQNATQRLQQAAKMEDRRVVTDADVQARLENSGATNVDQLYKKYVQGGKATDTATQAKELTRFDRAIKESKVLGTDEATIGQLETAAFKQPTAEMHGLTAGQAGQLMENLFQRGALPQTMGNLDAKGRVSAMAETKLDDATLDRLAQTMARRELQDKNEVGAGGKRFSDMTATEQQEEVKTLANASGSFRDQIKATQAEAEKTARGDAGAKSAEDVLQMAGGEALAGNVDASRTASRLKEYSDSVSAIRDIFGDNGNPNAPMPALMAVLDQLTQGAMGSMNPARAATTLRQMQTMARETGTGMQQLAAMSSQAGALGQQLGIAPAITMQNVAMSMGMTKTAMDRGAFSGNAPGAMTKEQFQQEAISRLQHGDASDNAKSMAAMRRIYEADPEKFKGTELEAAVGAYKDRSSGGDYTYDPTPDKPNSGDEVKRNLFDSVGRGGQFEAQRLIEEGGGSLQDFFAAAYDPRTMTEEFAVSGAGFMTQKQDIIRNIAGFGGGGTVENALGGTALGEEVDREGGGTIELGNALTEMVLDSSNMGVTQQVSFLEKHMPEKLAQHFEKQGMSADEAKKMAQQVVTQTFGDEKGGIDKSKLNRLIGNVGQSANDFYGKNLVELNQFYGGEQAADSMEEMARSEAHAAATKRLVGVGSESTPMGRMSDYFMDIGKRGEKFDLGNFVKEMSPFVSDKEILQRYAGEMGAGMHTLSSMRDKVQVTDEHINKLAKDGNIDELKRLGGVDKDEVIVTDADMTAAREKRIADMSQEDVSKEYAKIRGLSGPNATAHIPLDEQRAFLKSSEQFAQEADQEYLNQQQHDTGKKHISTETLKSRAMRSVGQALKGKEAQHADIEAVQKAIYRGDDKDAQTAAISAVGRLFKDAGGKAGALAKDAGQLTKLMEADGEAGTDAILKQLGLSKEDFEKNKSLAANDKSAEQRLAEVMTAVQRSDEQQQIDKVSDEKTAQNVAQKTDKVELDAQNVYINGAKAGASEQTPTVTPQKPGSAVPTSKEAIDAEIAAINKKESALGVGVGWSQMTKEDQQRREELIKQREALTAEDKKQADAAPAPQADKPLSAAKTADKDPATANSVRQQTDAAAVQAVGVPVDEAAQIILDAERAEKQQQQKYDIDPRDFTQSASQAEGSYASISGPFRDRDGKPIDRPTDGEYFDAMHTVDREKGDAQGRTGRVGQIGDKYYEEYDAGGGANAWREVAVGENKTEAEKIADKNDKALQQQTGAEPPAPGTAMDTYNAWKNLEKTGLQPATAADKVTAKTADEQAEEKRRQQMDARYQEAAQNYNTSFSGNRLAQHVLQADVASGAAAETLPPEKTAGVQQTTGQLGSANIHPASANPQQAAAGGDYAGPPVPAGGGSGGNESITLNGSLRLEGLHEAILDAMGSKSVATPGGGVPVIPGKASGLGGMPSGRHNHTA